MVEPVLILFYFVPLLSSLILFRCSISIKYLVLTSFFFLFHFPLISIDIYIFIFSLIVMRYGTVRGSCVCVNIQGRRKKTKVVLVSETNIMVLSVYCWFSLDTSEL